MAGRAFNQLYAADGGVASQFNYGSENSQAVLLPDSINYRLPQAVGIPKNLKRCVFYPSGISSQKLGPNDKVRFVINAQEFLDPMSTFLKFNVTIPDSVLADSSGAYDRTDPTKSLNLVSKLVQLDNSAQSFISSFKAYSGATGEDIERIDNYDSVACFLNDMASCNAGGFRSIDYSGNGGAYGSSFNNQVYVNWSAGPSFQTGTGTGAPAATQSSTTAFGPTGAGGTDGITPNLFYDPTRDYNFTPRSISKTDAADAANSTARSNEYYGDTQWPDNRAYRPNQVPLPVYHILHDCPNMGFDTPYGDGYAINYQNINMSIGSGITPNVGAATQAITDCVYRNDTQYNTALAGNSSNGSNLLEPDRNAANRYTSSVHGSPNPYPSNFGKTSFEPCFSNIPQQVIYNGIPSVQVVKTMTFIVPLLSGVFGSLIQPNNYKLQPMVAYKNLTFEFELNPYALFTSFSSTSYTDRSYTIDGMELQCDMVEFLDLNVIDATNRALAEGFVLCTQSYYLGPEYVYENNNLPPSIQVNLGFDSMRSVLIALNDNSYKMNTMFRKQYRMSGNITSLQLKIGTEYFPQQPIEGNGGNNHGKVNNYNYWVNLLKCFNKFNTREELGINLHNFALNWRELYYAYKIGAQLAGMNSNGTINPLSGATLSAANSNKGQGSYNSYPAYVANGMQLGIYYENRAIGKALYGISCTPANYENNMLEGKNTTNVRPFDLLFKSLTSGIGRGYNYPGSVTLSVYIYYDLVISFSNGTVKALGRG